MFSHCFRFLIPFLLLSSVTVADLADRSAIGPLTPLSAKATRCNVLDYGGVADGRTDIAPAISKAYSSCAIKGGATIYVPPGNYSMSTQVVINKASKIAIQIDGLITLTTGGSFKGNAFIIENSSDVEFYSSNGLGAINGQGYYARKTTSGQNARLIRFISCNHFSIHDFILVDSPSFHLIFLGATNLEVYHITIRGPNIGGTDGIDLACASNCYLHHVQVTNRDECISVKSPSANVLLEEIYCNHSGGMSMGSLAADGTVAVSDITMRNIYDYQCTQMINIKTYPGGSGAEGYVKNCVFENFWAYDTTYALEIDQYWESASKSDTGAVKLSNLVFNNFTGTMDNGQQRGAIVIRGSDIVPLVNITLTDVNMWTVTNNKVINICQNVYGSGYCVGTSPAANPARFTSTVTNLSPSPGFKAPVKPTWAIEGYGTTDPIPVYTPAVFWPPGSASATPTSHTTSNIISIGTPVRSTPSKSTPHSSLTTVKSTTSNIFSIVTAVRSTTNSSLKKVTTTKSSVRTTSKPKTTTK